MGTVVGVVGLRAQTATAMEGSKKFCKPSVVERDSVDLIASMLGWHCVRLTVRSGGATGCRTSVEMDKLAKLD